MSDQPQSTPNPAPDAPQEPVNTVAGTDTPEAPVSPAEGKQEAPEQKAPAVDYAAEYEALKAKYEEAQSKASEYDKYLDAQKTEAERQAEAYAKVQDDLAAQMRENEKLRIAQQFSLGESDISAMYSDDRAEMAKVLAEYKADAEKFRAAMKGEEERVKKGAPTLLPKADLKPGATPGTVSQPPSTDRGYPSDWVKRRA